VFKEIIYAEVTVDTGLAPVIENVVADAKPRRKPPSAGSRVVLIANTHKVVIRVAELTGRDRRLSPATKWRLVQDNFPIGAFLNADTHIFDGSVFKNSEGEHRFMMAALSKAIAEPMGEMAAEKWKVSKLLRLDTIEHMLFRQFANEGHKWVVFPQSEGFRILHINNSLPQGANYISNHPEFRNLELERAWEANMPSSAIILSRTTGVKPDTPDLPEERGDYWIRDFLQGRGVGVSHEDLSFK